ncbi:MAG TPA: AAA family ATPase [Solirubrobacteraceae bacterium]|nr:AAA family ATPase [Solirubrobacteraceae bacterium]
MLRVRLLGALEVERDGAVIETPPSQRPWAVFAYLALAPRPVSRAELASRFWPDVLDQSARASLRSAVWALRRHLGDALEVDRERLALRSGDGLWIDVREFERLAGDGAAPDAWGLCRGELLEGMEDEWAMAARERHRERVIALLERLAREQEDGGRAREAIDWTRRQVDLDPFDEEAHRRLISRLDASGDRAGALRTYRTLAERLRRELGVAPSGQTRELIERLRTDAAPPAAPAPAPVPPAPAAPPGLLPLVGREQELAELERAWRAVTQVSGAVALVRAEAGMGKTRLATELRRRVSAGGAHAASSAALDLGGSAPLSLWAELIRELLPGLAAPPADSPWPEDLAVLASELPGHFARGGAASTVVAPDLQRTRLFEAVVALLSWAARERPVLLVLEDVHAADRPSLELAGYVARRAAGLPIMMVLTRRELPHSADADRLVEALRSRGLLACELPLAPLAPEPVAALAARAASLSAADVQRVVDRAEGNALLAVETARALGRGLGEEVAPSLRSSVRATLSLVPGEVRKLVELIAVAARAVAPEELRALALAEPDEDASGALETGLLLAAQGRLGFRHALLRDAVYEEIAEPRRRGLHMRWATALLACEQAGGHARPAEAARHLRLAGADTEAVPELARAASDARRVAALEQAVGYLEEALAIAPGRAELELELGELEAWRGRREEAEAAFARALALLEGGEPLTLARAWLRRARAYHGPICVPRAVLESCRVALELLGDGGEMAAQERREALAALAWAEAVAGSAEEAERLLAQLGAGFREGEPAVRAQGDLHTYDVGHARALALMRRGRFVESYPPAIAAGEAVARAGRPDLAYGCWANAAGAAAAAGELDRALEFVDRGFDAIARQGLQSLEIHLLAARSFLLTRLGLVDEAREAAASEQGLAEQLAQPELVAMASHDRGLVALAAGEHVLAAALLREALAQAGAPISRPLTRLRLAEVLARAGEREAAAEQLRATVLEPVRPSDFPDTLVPRLALVQGVLALAREDRTEAEQRLRESIAGWEHLLHRTRRAESMTTVLADLGRPVVGLVEPERELARAQAELATLMKGSPRAVVP